MYYGLIHRWGGWMFEHFKGKVMYEYILCMDIFVTDIVY